MTATATPTPIHYVGASSPVDAACGTQLVPLAGYRTTVDYGEVTCAGCRTAAEDPGGNAEACSGCGRQVLDHCHDCGDCECAGETEHLDDGED